MRTQSWRNRSTALLALSIALTSAGCGGEDLTAPPPILGSNPTPTPVPTPTPSPSPSPSPTPGPALAGAKVGETIEGPLVCSDGIVTRASDGSVTGIGPISRTKLDNTLALTYVAPDTFYSDLNGFGGSQWTPADKRVAPNQNFVRYANPAQGELQLTKVDFTFVTHGLENSTGLCFFAAGLRAQSLPSFPVEYLGVIDGFAVISGQQKRLFGSLLSDPVLIMDFATGRGKLEFQLVARSHPFGDFEKDTGELLGTVSADLQLNPASQNLTLTTLTGSGFNGRVTGIFVDRNQSVLRTGGAGVALVFELTRPNGDLLFGTIALAANVM